MHTCIGEGNGNPLQYSCLENPRDGGAGWASVYGVAQSRRRLMRLGSTDHCFSFIYICFSLGNCSDLLPIFFHIGLFVFLLLSFQSSLYILDLIPLSDMWFQNIFHSLWLVFFIILIVSLRSRKIELWSPIYYFSFMSYVFNVISKKFFPNPRSKKFLKFLQF